MTDKSDDLVCKFTGEIKKQGNRHVVEIPETEIDYGTLTTGEIVQISVQATQQNNENTEPQSSEPAPPVSDGQQLTVEIEDIGDQGDGIARVDRGYVLIVPDTEPGDQVEVEVQQTNSNYGFAQALGNKDVKEGQEMTF